MVCTLFFNSYPSDLKQFAHTNNTFSKINTVKKLVSQGTVLSSVLFLIYVSTLKEVQSDICIKIIIA